MVYVDIENHDIIYYDSSSWDGKNALKNVLNYLKNEAESKHPEAVNIEVILEFYC